MWIRLTQPFALFYSARVEPARSVHSIGDPRGAQLIAAGLAEPAASRPENDEGTMPANMDPIHTQPPQHSQLADCGEMSAEASALVAALGRRRRKNT